MEILRITHSDFTLTIECSHFWQEWQKGVRNMGDAQLTSGYSWTEGVEKVERTNEEESWTAEIIAGNPNEKAFFFVPGSCTAHLTPTFLHINPRAQSVTKGSVVFGDAPPATLNVIGQLKETLQLNRVRLCRFPFGY